jgi:hypothetical protein
VFKFDRQGAKKQQNQNTVNFHRSSKQFVRRLLLGVGSAAADANVLCRMRGYLTLATTA